MYALPSPNGADGRGAGGRFAAGNPGGPGSPHARRSAEVRSAMFAAVTDDDVTAIVHGLVERARAGDPADRPADFEAIARQVRENCDGWVPACDPS